MTELSRLFLAITVGMLLVQAQTPPKPEQYPGQHNDAEPPKGYYCNNLAKDAAHKCTCKRMIFLGPDEPKPKDPHCCAGDIVEDKTCSVYCHMDHCTCEVTCVVGTGGSHNHAKEEKH